MPKRDHPQDETISLQSSVEEIGDDASILFAVAEGLHTSRALPKQGKVVIGRDSTCDVQLDHASVSRQHATLTLGTRMSLRDHGSKNGTRVGGQRLAPEVDVELALGAMAEVGSVTLLVQRMGKDIARSAGAQMARRPPEPGEHQAIVRGAVARMMELVDRVADSTISVLLLGETGVGKDVFAESLHQRSGRRDRPFVRLHCASIAESLFESELFGHERGAFTGADRAKSGLLESAEGGTVFLDEIGELPLPMQVKLLRVLEDRRVTRVGSVQARRIDVRFVAATNRDLERETAAGRFRRDLYYRLGGITLVVPPLRERRDEIEALARSFLGASPTRAGGTLDFDERALSALRAHSWPGNIRELRNVVERAALLARGAKITVEDLALAPRNEPADPLPPRFDERTADEQDEIRRIQSAIARTGGNQTEAARLLGISRRTLVSRLGEYAIARPRRK